MHTFKVRDFRNKQFFQLDDEYLNGYARLFDPSTTVIYLSLCRHANKEQSAFPSEELIAEEHNISIRTVISKLKILKDWNLIKTERERTDNGKWLRNTYYLLDKSEWKPKPSANIAHGQPSANNSSIQVQITANTQVQPLHTKDTHIIKETNKKDTHTLLRKEEKPLGFGLSDINECLDIFTTTLGHTLPKVNLNRFALHRLIKSKGIERVKKATVYALSLRGDQYAPLVNTPMDLEHKWDSLEAYVYRKGSGSKSVTYKEEHG